MLAAAALIVRRSARADRAVVVYALFCVCMVVGIPPVFGIVSALPGFNAAHNERLLIYFLLCLALLAGWGLDDLSAIALPPPEPPRGARRRAATIFCIPIVWMVARRDAQPRASCGAGLKVAWGFAHPPLPPPGVDVEGTVTGAIVRDSSLRDLAPAGRRRAGADRRCGSAPAPTAAGGAVRRADRRAARRRPVPRQHGLQPGDPDQHARRRRSTGAIRYLQSQRPNRFIGVSTRSSPAAARRPGDDVRPLRRARLRLPGREALRRAVATVRGTGLGDFTAARGIRAGAPRVAARARPAERVGPARRPAAGDQVRRCTRPGLRVAYRGQRRRRLRQRERAAAGVRGRPPADRGRTSGAQLATVTAPASTAAASR